MTQTDSPSIRPVSAFLGISLKSAGTAVALGLVGYWPTSAQAGSVGVSAMLVGIGIALIGAWLGTLPTIACLPQEPRRHANGILLGLAVRFAITLGLGIAVLVTGCFSVIPLLLWLAIAQMVILMVDVWGLVTLLRRAARMAR